ncbi:Na(+)-translocating NADH-quinone reductase subunit A [Gymnodinialimonas sp. 2305UL16-5]|uniref:Na(+)-translocating NADH-quinone reductase subunit A n=1 Tax=Gymnodinialimonas mytili TaxID=3126503 RepID=UPI00309E479D
MTFFRSGAGLIPEFPSPHENTDILDVATEEAGVQPPFGQALHVTPLVAEGELVARGAAVACLRNAPDICLVAPIPGRVARISLLPGRKLSEIILFREENGGIARHAIAASTTGAELRRLMQTAGFWPRLRRRPFGGMPKGDEVPAAIFVMGVDTRPYAPDPQQALEGREASFERGLAALYSVTDGPVFVCWPDGSKVPGVQTKEGDLRWITCGPRHPQGSAGIRIHQAFPAGLDATVWDIHAEDVADLGELLDTGALPVTRLLRIAGAGLREGLSVRTHPGADLRQLTRRIAAPGPHVLMSGSHLDGRPARWLGHRHRQVTVLPRDEARPRPHWLIAALTETAATRPVIPTAALNQSLGAVLHATPFIRALGAGDDELAMDLGLLSLLEEDVALADYALGADGGIMQQVRAMLDRIRVEYAP